MSLQVNWKEYLHTQIQEVSQAHYQMKVNVFVDDSDVPPEWPEAMNMNSLP